MHSPESWRKLWTRRRFKSPANGENKQLPRWPALSRDQLRSLPNDVSGWWLILAEVLAVVVLLVLAAVAGQTAQDLLAKIDRYALADLARSDPLEVCVNGAATFTGRQFEGPLTIEPDFNGLNSDTLETYEEDPLQEMRLELVEPLQWGELLSRQIVGVEEDSTDEDWVELSKDPFNLFKGHEHNVTQRTLLDEATTTAMYPCGLIAGITWGDDFIQALRNNTLGALPQWQPDGEDKFNASFGGRKYQLTVLHRFKVPTRLLDLLLTGGRLTGTLLGHVWNPDRGKGWPIGFRVSSFQQDTQNLRWRDCTYIPGN